jgi:serine/threonine protein kinase
VCVQDLIKHLLVVNPEKRFTAGDVLAHKWLHGTVSSLELSSAVTQMRVFQQSRRSIVKRGELIKQGHFVRNWKKRTFLLTSDTLEYYDPVDAAAGAAANATSGTTPSSTASGAGASAGKDASGSGSASSSSSSSSSSAAAAAAPVSLPGARPKGTIPLKDIRAVTLAGETPAPPGTPSLSASVAVMVDSVTPSASSSAAAAATVSPTAAGGTSATAASATSPATSAAAASANQPTTLYAFKLVTSAGKEYLLQVILISYYPTKLHSIVIFFADG